MKPPEQPLAPKRKLKLNRETVHNLTDQLLTTQGWSLWTCDTSPQGSVREPDRRRGRPTP